MNQVRRNQILWRLKRRRIFQNRAAGNGRISWHWRARVQQTYASSCVSFLKRQLQRRCEATFAQGSDWTCERSSRSSRPASERTRFGCAELSQTSGTARCSSQSTTRCRCGTTRAKWLSRASRWSRRRCRLWASASSALRSLRVGRDCPPARRAVERRKRRDEFPFYVLIKDPRKLPERLADALRQWFELANKQWSIIMFYFYMLYFFLKILN